MAPSIAFQEEKLWILQQISQGRKHKDIYNDLRDQGHQGSFRALGRRLRDWQARSRPPSVFTVTGIETTVQDLFYGKLCSDKEICLILQATYPGHKASRRTLRRFRRDKGWYRRTIPSRRPEQLQRIEKLLDEELKQGHLEDHGRHLLHTFMKHKYGPDLPIGEYVPTQFLPELL